MGNQYIDFKFVKENSDVLTILNALDIEGKQTGDEIRIRCINPNHEDENASCDVNTEKRSFFCHSCKIKGSILDLVALVEDCTLREAAIIASEICGIPLSDRTRKNGNTKRKAGTQDRPKKAASTPTSSPAGSCEADLLFSPFTTKLKLDCEHKFGVDRGLSDKLIAEFEMGFQDRGMFKDRWCIPVHDMKGNQLGYTGRWANKRMPKGTEKWLLPPKFPKKEVLFNAHRLGRHMIERGVILVEGPLDAIRLHSMEYPAASLLGTSISERQLEILSDLDVEFVLVMLDGDAPGRKAVPALLEQLSREFYVRDLKIPDGEDPETLSRDFLRENVWGL